MSYCKVSMIGRAGRDPDLRYTPQGTAVCDFSIAINDRKREKNGDWKDVTNWYKVTFWGKQAEHASKYLNKGRLVYVEGRFQPEEWTDRDGKNRTSMVVQGSEIQFLPDSRDGGNGGEYSGPSDSADDSNFSHENAPISDDDIPF